MRDLMYTCRDCKKEFKRPCDLTIHEKAHVRPWKCTEEKCKYFEFGWPTEKERDRHINDKHSADPAQYKCLYPPCTYVSKREADCKQHMETAHQWEYVRSKSNGRKGTQPMETSLSFQQATHEPSTTFDLESVQATINTSTPSSVSHLSPGADPDFTLYSPQLQFDGEFGENMDYTFSDATFSKPSEDFQLFDKIDPNNKNSDTTTSFFPDFDMVGGQIIFYPEGSTMLDDPLDIWPARVGRDASDVRSAARQASCQD
jgi:uncharacterized C2H2 Zn-finger protein